MPPDDDKTLSGILRTLGLPQHTPARAGPDSENGAIQGSPATQCPDQGIEPSGSTVEQVLNVHGMPPSERAGDSPHPAARGLLELAKAAGDIGGVIQNTASWEWDMAAEAMSQGHMVHPGYVPEGAALQGFSGKVSTPSQHQSVSGGVPSCPSLEDDDMSTTETVDELVDQLSDRVGTLHIKPGGHIRFYGSTSNFNLLETPASDVNMNVHRTIRNDGTEHLDRLGLNKNVPIELEDHLMNLYFTWQDPSFHAVDRKMFEEAKVIWRDKGEDTAYYSEALRNAM